MHPNLRNSEDIRPTACRMFPVSTGGWAFPTVIEWRRAFTQRLREDKTVVAEAEDRWRGRNSAAI